MHPDIDYYHWLETKKNTHKNSNKQRRRKKQQQLIIVARNSSIDDDNQLVFLLFLSSSLNKPVKQTSERMPCMQSLRSSFTCSFDVSFNLAFFLLSQRIWDFFCFGFGTCSGCSWRISCVSMCMDESLIHTSLLTKFFFVIYSVRFCLFFLLFLISASIKIVHVSVSFIWVVWTFSAFFLSLALDKIAWTRNFVVCINKYEWWLRCDHLRAVEKNFLLGRSFCRPFNCFSEHIIKYSKTYDETYVPPLAFFHYYLFAFYVRFHLILFSLLVLRKNTSCFFLLLSSAMRTVHFSSLFRCVHLSAHIALHDVAIRWVKWTTKKKACECSKNNSSNFFP